MSNKLLPVLYVPPTYEVSLRTPYGDVFDEQLKVLQQLVAPILFEIYWEKIAKEENINDETHSNTIGR